MWLSGQSTYLACMTSEFNLALKNKNEINGEGGREERGGDREMERGQKREPRREEGGEERREKFRLRGWDATQQYYTRSACEALVQCQHQVRVC